MANLKVICDDCFTKLGISNLHMSGPELMMVYGPMMQGPLGDTYTCSGCGRFYSVVLGYFNFIQRTGIDRRRPHPRCNNPNCKFDAMYIEQIVPGSRALFVCPGCGEKREEDV